MSTRSDLVRLAARAGLFGTEFEMKGELMLSRLQGWTQGPTKAAATGERGGGGTEVDADDRRDEQRQARRASVHYEEQLADQRLLDEVFDRMFRRMDMAVPPEVEQLRNRRTGEFEPETATDALAAGNCPNCWIAGFRDIELSRVEGKGQVRRYADRCRPCGDFRHAEGIDRPKELVKAYHSIPRVNLSPDEVQRIVNAARAAANPKGKKGRKAKRKKAA